MPKLAIHRVGDKNAFLGRFRYVLYFKEAIVVAFYTMVDSVLMNSSSFRIDIFVFCFGLAFSGRFFPLKMLLFEIVEIYLQMSSLVNSAHSSEASHVVISAAIIAANLILLGMATLVSSRCFPSSTTAIAAILAVEIIFDKLYVGLVVFVRR